LGSVSKPRLWINIVTCMVVHATNNDGL
jgi:hypothetical protein